MSNTMHRLAGQTVVYGISTVLVKLLNYILVPYLTRVMGQVAYGIYTQIYAFIPLALVVLTMGLESGYFRFAGKAGNETAKKGVFATAWGIVTAASLLFFALAAIFNRQLADAMGYGETPAYVWMTAGIIALDSIGAVPFARLREQGRAGKYVMLRLVSVIVNLALCFFFYGWLPSLAANGIFEWAYDPMLGPGYALLANLVASAVTLPLLLSLCGGVVPRIERRMARELLLYSLPLLLSGIAGTANEFIDRQMVVWLIPGDAQYAYGQLGIYGAVLRLGVVMTLFTTMYRLAAEPFFLAEFNGDDFRKTNAEAMKYFIIVSILIFLVIALFRDVFALILGSDFREGVWILPIVLLSNMLSGIVLNLSFWYKQTGATRYAIYVTGTGLIFTVVFNVLLVPKLGYVGAALARLICETSMVVFSYMLNQKHCPVPYDLRRIGGYFMLGAVLYGAGILCGGIVVWARYLIYFSLVVIFAVYAVRREHINVGAMLRSMLHCGR